MEQPIHLLQLEDNPNDTLFIQMVLEREGYICDMVRVESRNDFVAALEHNKFDLILSDMKLPSFDGLTALGISRQLVPDVPFIIVSGTMGEESAIESLVNGATDYVLKTRMARPVPARVAAVPRAVQSQRSPQTIHEILDQTS